MFRGLTAIAVCALFAGCAEGGREAAEMSNPDSLAPIAYPHQISWNECVGMGSSLAYYGNAFDIDGGQRPPGWEPDSQEDQRYHFSINRCERVSVGPYERGPVHFLYEAHGGIEPPQTCAEFGGQPDDVKVLLGLWVDDPEVAAYLRATYAMPVVDATMHLEVSDQSGQEIHTWSWSSGPDVSTMVGMHVEGDPGTPDYVDRLVWHNGTAVTMLDLRSDKSLSYNSPPVIGGILAPPMAYGQGISRPYSGLASVWPTSDYSGPIMSFGDLVCEQPLR